MQPWYLDTVGKNLLAVAYCLHIHTIALFAIKMMDGIVRTCGRGYIILQVCNMFFKLSRSSSEQFIDAPFV